jgi:Lon protease-like protein
MHELPLFPLNTVLFPGMPLTLHIFEERYKAMIGRCRREKIPFGVVLIRQGQEVGTPADPYAIGCTAEITRVQPLGDGRMNLLAVGRERFRTVELRTDRPYLVGMVETLPLPAWTTDVEASMLLLRPLVERYLDVLSEASEADLDLDQLPDDPLALAYLAASVLQVPPAQKQALLTIEESDELAHMLRALYRHEIAVLRALLSPPEGEVQSIGPFSAN